MYPETDIPPITVTAEHLARLASRLPERPAALRERLAKETGLAREVILQIVSGGQTDLFEELVRREHGSTLVARLLIQDVPAVPRAEGETAPDFSLALLDDLLKEEEAGRFAKEGIPNVLLELARGAPTVAAAVARAGLSGFTAAELETLIGRVLAQNESLLRSRGNEAFSALMGDVMREVRGRRDGQEVAEALRRAIARRQSDLAA
jgi:glutamyl-tRNA(Gln) amidotransferase subunit E